MLDLSLLKSRIRNSHLLPGSYVKRAFKYNRQFWQRLIDRMKDKPKRVKDL